MKKLIVIAVAGFFLNTSVEAQVTRSTDATQKVQSEKGRKMLAQSNMTEAQKTQLKETREEYKSRRDAIAKNPDLSEMQRKEKMRELTQEERSKMNGILTPEQRANIKQYRNDKEVEGRKGGKMKDLNLSEDQKSKMNDLRKQYKSESDAVKNNSTLSEGDKKQKLHDIRMKQQQQMKQILTPEQQTKIKNNKSNHPNVKARKELKDKKQRHNQNTNS